MGLNWSRRRGRDPSLITDAKEPDGLDGAGGASYKIVECSKDLEVVRVIIN